MYRKYLQFNDLVIDDFDTLSSADLSGGFKAETFEYSFAHGSYAPFKRAQQYASEQNLSLELTFDNRKLNCEQREQYKKFVFFSLSKPGRLWAIEGGRLLWAWAFVTDFSETYSTERHRMSLSVDFTLYEGVWHFASGRKTFFRPYDHCSYLDEYDFREPEKCDCSCLDCIKPAVQGVCPSCVGDCDSLSAENSLCNASKSKLEEFYNRCGGSYKIIYNCLAGLKIWGETEMLGQRICKKEICDSVIAGQLYNDTILETENATITLIGSFNNPVITINGNSARILGEYSGKLIVEPSGDIYYQNNECCEAVLLTPDAWEVPEGSHFGFYFHHGNNSIVVETNDCCSMSCAYIQVDSITV